ncbi:MAG: winged helix-turn-helix transcriptional regulator [Streptococcaceae bacterium]|jgi:DNA-binding MarR family transcriptional regulator|nr:winged helix-turn-helix transcriptional regulator [Streptococcaceae bacterium]
MEKKIQQALDDCVYFSVKKIDRQMDKIAEEAFRETGLAPTYNFILLILEQCDHKNQREIANMLHVAPSTIARFVDKLQSKGYVSTESVGRQSFVSLTELGRQFTAEDVNNGWENLHVLCDAAIGHEDSSTLNKHINATIDHIKESR